MSRRMRVIISSVILAMSMVAVSCGANLSLTNDEATKIIREQQKYPKDLVSGQINFWTWNKAPLATRDEMIKYLTDNGYIVSLNKKNVWGKPLYGLTDKGQKLIPGGGEITMDNNIGFSCAYGKEDISGVKEILIDKETKTAIVKYYTSVTPIEPYYSDVFMKSYEGQSNYIKMNAKEEHSIKFKKYDKGWRILE